MSSKSDISIPLLPNCAYHVFNRGNSEKPIFFEDDNYASFLRRFQDYTEGYIVTYAYCLLDNHYHFCIKIKSAKEILTKSLQEDKFRLDGNFLTRHVSKYVSTISDSNGIKKGVLLQKEEDSQLVLGLVDDSSMYYGSEEAHRALAHHILLELEREEYTSVRFEEHPISMKQLSFSIKLCSYLISQRMQRFFLSYAKFINKQQNRTGSLFQKTFHRKFLATDGDVRTVISYIHHNVLHHECGKTYEDYEWCSFRDYVARDETAITDESALITLFGGVTEFIECAEGYRAYKAEIDRWEKRQKNKIRLMNSMKLYPHKRTGMLAQLSRKQSADQDNIDSS